MGAVEVDNMLMLLSTSNKMTEKERDIIMPLVLQGFKVKKKISSFKKFSKIFFSRNVLMKQVQLFKVVKQ
jgi:hypothetical protein